MENLKERFCALWDRCLPSGSEADAEPAWALLERHYSEPRRHYHNFQHLTHCLEQFDTVADCMEQPEAVEMSLWFHDVIYNPYGSENELRSVQCFRQVAGNDFPADFVQAVSELIMGTTHQTALTGSDEQITADIDLSSFSLPWDEFVRDNVALRQEQARLSDEEYYSGKRKFLEVLLARPRIFYTDVFARTGEEVARNNIQSYLRELEQGKVV